MHSLSAWLLAAGIACSAAGTFGGVCVDPPSNLLCLNWAVDAGNITFSATCMPPPGMNTTFWCAFGVSTASTGDMFPADVVAVQSTASGFWLEDRDSFIGYRSPPCYATQLSYLLNASLTLGALRAAWTRPLTVSSDLLQQHYQSILTGGQGMTLIAASSADTSAAVQRCNPDMQLHTYCVPGIRVYF